MSTPTLNIYDDILLKWHEFLTGDARIGGRDIRVIYTRTEPEELDINLMPYVAYFLERNWNDNAIGSGSYSPQSRRVYIKIGFLLAMMGKDAPTLDKMLFEVGGNLLDILRERQLFDTVKQIIVKGDINWDFDTIAAANGQQIGTQQISFTMEQFANFA